MYSRLPALDTSDRPFGLPVDIVLDIPVPPSVNRTRRLNRAAMGKVDRWKVAADAALMASGQYRAAKRRVFGRFELQIILSDDCRLDLDNPVKAAIDYLRRIEVIADDSPKYLRKLTVTWGEAPAGCRLILRGAE